MLGTTAQFWMALQTDYDLEVAASAADLAELSTWRPSLPPPAITTPATAGVVMDAGLDTPEVPIDG